MRPVALALTVLAAATHSTTLIADDTEKRSAELQVLDRFVGTWDLVVTSKPTGGETTTEKTAETRTWSRGGRFVHFDNSRKENPELPEFHMLLTYDSATKTYPGVLMSGPSRTVVTGTWDAENQTMKFDGTGTDSNTLEFKHRFTDKDHAESTGIIMNRHGDVLVEMTFKQTRRKK